MNTLDNTDLTNVTVTERPAPTGIVLASEGRTISGRVLPWEEEGATSAGGLRFTPSAIRIPTDLTRVKLLRDHSPAGVPVGVMTGWETKPDGLYATFQVASTDDGERALVEAREHIRDSFSVEVSQVSRRGPDVTDSLLRAVALVPYPAFQSARVDSVNAAEHADEDAGDALDDDDTDDAGDALDEDDADEDAAAGVPAPADTDPDTNTDDDDAVDDQEDHQMDTDQRADARDNTTAPRPAAVPAGLSPSPAATADKLVTASDVAELVLAVRNGRADDEAHAELTDITNSDAIDAVAPAWLGRLWDGVTYQRRIVPLLTNAPLRGWKAAGYRWTTKPGVDKYAGDKTEIPSKPAAIEPVEVTAQRWAGGNDLDRKFMDFNDSEFLSAYWSAMAESYAYETDREAGAFLVDNATAIPERQPDLIRAVATAAIEIDQDVHTPASFALINPADLTSILAMSQLDAPRWMDLTPVSDPSKWVTSEFVPAGTVIVGAKPAVTHFELAGSPLRANAEHIARGGFDAALFGYTAMLLNRPEALRKIEFGTVTDPAGA